MGVQGSEALMDYYQGVDVDYLRADRAVFVNAECMIRINPAGTPDTRGSYWYCDAVAADFRLKTIFLCEVTYAKDLAALKRRLKAWHDKWDEVGEALRRDSCVLEEWSVRPWLFVPESLCSKLVEGAPTVVES
jgi:hypothetical protein